MEFVKKVSRKEKKTYNRSKRNRCEENEKPFGLLSPVLDCRCIWNRSTIMLKSSLRGLESDDFFLKNKRVCPAAVEITVMEPRHTSWSDPGTLVHATRNVVLLHYQKDPERYFNNTSKAIENSTLKYFD